MNQEISRRDADAARSAWMPRMPWGRTGGSGSRRIRPPIHGGGRLPAPGTIPSSRAGRGSHSCLAPIGGLRPLVALLLAALLGGCTALGSGETSAGAPLNGPERYELLLRLKESADRIQATLDRMVAVNQSALSVAPAHPAKPSSGPFARRVDFTWGGPLEPALAALAGIAGLPPPEVKGRRPAVPVTIDVHAVDRSVADVLEDIGWKAGDRAWVHLDAARGVIALGYPAGAAGSGPAAADEAVEEVPRKRSGRSSNPGKKARKQ